MRVEQKDLEKPIHTPSTDEDKVMVVCPWGRGKRHTCAQNSALIQNRGLLLLGEGQDLLGPRSPTNSKLSLVVMGERTGTLPMLWIQNLVRGRSGLSLEKN